jgi:hypothetical protein
MGNDGLIDMNNKDIALLDMEGIQDLAEGATTI